MVWAALSLSDPMTYSPSHMATHCELLYSNNPFEVGKKSYSTLPLYLTRAIVTGSVSRYQDFFDPLTSLLKNFVLFSFSCILVLGKLGSLSSKSQAVKKCSDNLILYML